MSKKQIKTFIFGAVFGISVTLGTVSVARYFGLHLYIPGSASQQLYDKAKVVEKCIDDYYQGEIKDEDLIDYGVKGMVSALGDKYSQYYTSEEYKTLMEGINGVYVGIGVTLQKEGSQVLVADVTEDGPAQKAGVLVGDQITAIDGKNLADMELSSIVAMIKSDDKEGQEFLLTVQRSGTDGQTESTEIAVTCERIEIVSVMSEKIGKIGYIRIKKFDKGTDTQFQTIIENMKSDDVEGLVIDVRENGGGSLDSTIHMLDELLPAGDLITEKSKKDGDTKYESTDEKHFDKPITVLMNENSASASEVFAGTLQARGAAKLVGTKSFGKGIVQTVLSLENSCGGGLKLTTAEYFLPNGVSIHETGLTPDVEVAFQGSEEDEFVQGKDNQLQKALDLTGQ